jgi:hypothetical protein
MGMEAYGTKKSAIRGARTLRLRPVLGLAWRVFVSLCAVVLAAQAVATAVPAAPSRGSAATAPPDYVLGPGEWTFALSCLTSDAG